MSKFLLRHSLYFQWAVKNILIINHRVPYLHLTFLRQLLQMVLQQQPMQVLPMIGGMHLLPACGNTEAYVLMMRIRVAVTSLISNRWTNTNNFILLIHPTMEREILVSREHG